MTDASSKDPVKGVYVLYCSSHISTLQGSCICLFSQVFLFLSFSQDFSSKCLCSSTLSRRCFCFSMPRYHMNYFRPELKMRPWLLRGCGPNSSGHGPCPWPMSMAHGFLKLIWYVTDMSLTCLESHQTVPILDSHSTLPSHLWRDQRRKGQTWRCLDFAWGIE